MSLNSEKKENPPILNLPPGTEYDLVNSNTRFHETELASLELINFWKIMKQQIWHPLASIIISK